MTCARCLEPIDLTRRKRCYKRCATCQKNYHRACLKLHNKHAHTADDRAPFNHRRFV